MLLYFVRRLISHPDLLSTKPQARSGQIRFVNVIADLDPRALLRITLGSRMTFLLVRNVTGDGRAHAQNKRFFSNKTRLYADHRYEPTNLLFAVILCNIKFKAAGSRPYSRYPPSLRAPRGWTVDQSRLRKAIFLQTVR